MESWHILKKLFAPTVAFMAMALMSATMAFAVPAAPGVFTVSQPDGTVVNTIVRGDEHQNWMETEQGHTIAKGVDGNWYYAADPMLGVPASGSRAKMAGGVKVEFPLTNVRAENPPLANLPKHIKPPKMLSPLMGPMFGTPSLGSAPSLGSVSPLAASTPPVGSHSGNMLILLVDFTDRAGTYTATGFSGFFNSVATYYNTVSNGNVTLTSVAETHGTANDGVIGWLRLPYAHPSCGNSCGPTLIQDAITEAAPYVNFAAYDSSGDGRITGDELAVIVFAAGYENSIGGAAAPTPNVWGHANFGFDFTIPGSTTVVDGYTLMGEIHGSHQATLGIVVHELGHLMFRWPDLYDIDDSSEGIGNWCLMSGGTWGKTSTDLYQGKTPVMPSAWLRKKSGWVNTQPANGTVSVTAAGDATATANNTVMQAVTSGAATEYFLIENRQNQGYDRGLQGLIPSFAGGLAIWHIDDSITCVTTNDCNATDAHRMVNLEAPDGWTAPVGKRGAATNLWYAGNGVSFDSTSTPNSNLYKEWWQFSAPPSGVSVSGISTSGKVMSAIMSAITTDITPPTISVFNATPSSITQGSQLTISLTTSDSGGSGLNRVEFKRSNGDGTAADPNWTVIGTTSLFGNGPQTATIHDQPTTAGTWWYGAWVYDNDGNHIDERGAGLGPKSVMITAPVSTTPTITSVSPPSLTTSPSAQPITIYGANFTNTSTLVFYAPDGTQTPQRTPIYDSPSQLRYTATFPTSGGWKVKVVNGIGVESTPFTFYVSSSSASVTLTGLSITGPATVNENSTASFTATALFSDSSTSSASATWSVIGSAASINQSTGQLTAYSVLSDTPVTVSASYSTGGITKTASANVTIVNLGGGGGTQTQELITNGSFSSIFSGWTLQGVDSWAGTNLNNYRTSPGYAALGVNNSGVAINNADGAFYQTISIPANATSATLGFWYYITTNETTSSIAYDNLYVTIRDSSGNFLANAATLSNLNKTTGYVQKTFNLAPYIGQIIRVRFGATSNLASTTIFRIDDVSVTATVPVPVTLSSLVITGPSSVTEGNAAQYSATALFSDGTTSAVTTTGWSTNPSYATISNSGYFSAGQVGSDTIVAISTSYTAGGVTQTATKNVTIANVNVAPTYSSLFISGPISINENSSGQFTAVAIFSDGSAQAASPIWSQNSSAASISSSGLLTAGAVNSDTSLMVSASYTLGGVTHNANQNVTILNVQQLVAPVITSAGAASGTANVAFSYLIAASNSPTSYGASGLPAGLSVNTSSGLISGIPSVTGTFYATVTAANAVGTSSMPVTITIAPVSDATPPTDGTLTASAGSGQVSLSWSGFSDSGGIASYKLVYSITSTPSSCSAGTQIYSGTGTSYTHTTNATIYYYRLCAVDNAGNTSSGVSVSNTPGFATLIVNKSGSGTVTGGNSINCGNNCSETGAINSVLNLTITADNGWVITGYSHNTTTYSNSEKLLILNLLSASRSGGSNYTTWSGTVTLDQDTTINVTFADTTPTTGTISINSGTASTNSTTATLSISCTDANGCSQMQFSNDNSTWSTAETYTTSKAWTLSSGDGTKTVYVKFKDAAGNISGSFSDTIILDTTSAEFTSAAPYSDSLINTATIGYTLSEAVASGKVTFTQTGGTADPSSPQIYNLAAPDMTLGSHTVNTGLSLVNGAIYTVTFEATDPAGNVATPISGTNVSFDSTTASVTINTPASGSVTNNLSVGYTLSETISSGNIVVTRTGGNADAASPHTYTLAGAELAAGSHSVTTGMPLVDGAVYTVSIENVFDLAGNNTASVANTSIIYDSTSVAITNTTPAANSTIADATVSYTLSEQATSGKITFTQTGGSADAGSPHEYTLTGADLYPGDHTVDTGLGFVDGAIYTVSVDAIDMAGNAATTVSNAIVLFDNIHDITVTITGSGTVTPTGATGVSHEDTRTFTATPDPGYHIASITGCGGTLLNNAYTTAAITADCTLAATFASGNTIPPAFTSTSPAANSQINKATVGYTLSSAVFSGKITFARTGGTADSSVHVYNFASSDITAGTHSINTGLVLVNGAVYTVTFEATDSTGNTGSLSSTNVTYDTSSASVTISSPVANSVVNNAKVSYTLSEDVSAGEIVFTRTGGAADGMSPYKYTLAAADRTKGSYTIDTGKPLMSGTIYTLSFENVTDMAGNATVGVSNTSITYDSTAVAITNTTPASNAIITNSTVGYTLSEAASSGKVTFTRSGGSPDSGSPHIYTLSGSDLYVGSHSVNTTLSVVSGAFYTVSFNATDFAGNPATTVSNAMVYYDTNYGIGPLGNVDNSGYSLNRVDGYDLITLYISFDSKPGDANWNPVCDLDKSGKVDGSDLITLGAHFGEVQ